MSIFDQSKLRETCGDDPAFWAIVLDEFESSGEEGLCALRVAVERGDLDRAYHALHTLKGSARTVGAEEIGDVAARWESALTEHGPGVPAIDLDEIEAAWRRFVSHRRGLREAA